LQFAGFLLESEKIKGVVMLKDLVTLGVGSALLAKEKVEEELRKLIEKGKMSKEEAEKLMEKAKARGEEQEQALKEEIKRALREVFEEMGIATKEDIEKLGNGKKEDAPV
jgi:polyhydroxyalkanoate synthesis regulator phasin